MSVIKGMVHDILTEMATESRDWVEHVVNWLIQRLKDPDYSQKAYATERGFAQGEFNRAVGKYGKGALARLKKLGHHPDLYEPFLARNSGTGRPSKLSELEWQELVKDYLQRRVAGNTITPAQIAREYGVLPATFEIKVVQYEKHYPELSGKIADAEKKVKDAADLAKKPKGMYLTTSPYISPEPATGDTKTTLPHVIPGSSFTFVSPNREQALSNVIKGTKETPSPGPSPRPAHTEIKPWQTLDGWKSSYRPKILVVGGEGERSIPLWVKHYFEVKQIGLEDESRVYRGDPLGNFLPDLIVLTRWAGHAMTQPIQKAAKELNTPVLKAMPGWASAISELKSRSDHNKFKWFVDAAQKGGMNESGVDDAIFALVQGDELLNVVTSIVRI